MNSSYTSSSTKPIYHGTQIIWYILGIIGMLLIFRFFLKLLGANTSSEFTQFVYNVSGFFTAPFDSVFPNTTVQGNVFEWTTLVALAVYWVVAAGIIRLFLMSRTVSTPEAAEKLEDRETAN